MSLLSFPEPIPVIKTVVLIITALYCFATWEEKTLFFFKIHSAILGPLPFHIYFRFSISSAMKNHTASLTEIALNF